MEWKQPEGLRRHWVLEELDGELLFLPTPPGAAQGRIGDDVYDLRDAGSLRKKRTLSVGKMVLATMEGEASGAIVRYGQRELVWKQQNVFGTRWVLLDGDGKVVFAYASKQGLGKSATVDAGGGLAEDAGPLLLLCWYVTVL